jgi:large subunit ribosomal protein L4
VLDSLTLEGFKTKAVIDVLSAIKSGKRVLIVMPTVDEKVVISARNIPGVKTTIVGSLNVYDILNCDTFIVLKDAVTAIEEVYA